MQKESDKGQTMNKIFLTAGLVAVSASTLGSSALVSAEAAPAKPAASASVKASAKPLPRYVSLETLKRLQKQHDPRLIPAALQPLIDGKSLKGQDRRDLITDPPLVLVNSKTKDMEVTVEADAAVAEGASDAAVTTTSMDGERIAQVIPPPVRPATPRRTPARTVMPRWVRYPLEFQLLGIGLGTKAVDKDKYNRIDRYGLFAIHGNPTAVVVPTAGGGAVQVNQQPPEVARIFPNSGGDYLPDWASAITVQLDNNHVEWLYRRDTYSMGFVVDRLGFVDAIVVAGVYSPIARTQLEDPVHTIKLGDDLRKVLFRYGYPDTIETYPVNYAAGIAVGANGQAADAGAAAGGAAGAAGAAGGQPPVGQVGGAQAGAAAAGGGGAANSATRTFEVRYEQSYNVVFTVRNNRVVRIYIFGDPDFFNEQRRNAIRTQY
jgi:hypothetical protein